MNTSLAAKYNEQKQNRARKDHLVFRSEVLQLAGLNDFQWHLVLVNSVKIPSEYQMS